ncbi:hypothetical protein Hypma_005180 [Hypsizygus marmoreus]|uniref:Uncharacterized protein n=1 Tax=Hypsizygus marmoreus TaxID=39966 RepID=A0A369IZH7_HYPMA|nr:hypothetical protein Hypma_005180 [Hypsizygus marmoreus]
MAERPISVFYTHPFSPGARQALEALLSNVSEWMSFSSIPNDNNHHGLSPAQLFRQVGHSWPEHPFAIIADQQTAAEIDASRPPTVIVVASWQITLHDEWDLYDGPENPATMPEAQRIAFLRELAEARAIQEAQESGGEEWFWEPNSEQNGIDAVKIVRADLAGMGYICTVYGVKDIRDMHQYFKRTADSTGGVFHSP